MGRALLACLLTLSAATGWTQTHPYSQRVLEETRALAPRAVLGDVDPDAWLPKLFFVSVEGEAAGEQVAVDGPGFRRAWRIRTERKPAEWMTHLQGFFKMPIKTGDLLYLTAYARVVTTKDGRAEGTGRLYASEERGGNQKDSAALFGGDFAIRREWTRVHFPLRVSRDHGADDELKLMFTFGHLAQTVEIGGLCLVQFPASVTKEQLPHEELRLDYEGREAGAAWRKAALARIEQVRKAPLTVTVRDTRGRPVRGADVRVEMTRSAFRFGTSLPVGMLPGQNVKPWNADFQRTAGASPADKARLQKEFLRLFNSGTYSVTWILWYGGDARISRADIIAGLKWLKSNGIDVRNTQAVYPGPEFTPQWARDLMNPELKDEFQQAIREYLRITGDRFSPYMTSIQIANELEGRPAYTQVTGQNAVLDWFRWGKAYGNGMEVMVNGAYQLGGTPVRVPAPADRWPTSDGLQWYAEFIAWLNHHRAPLDTIGFQHHSGIGAPSPIDVLRSLDAFAKFGIPIEITEFEITLQNGADARQRAYQADATRDFLIACYSHPAVSGILLQDFWQPGAWQAEGASAFFNADWSLNPHGKAYEDLVLGQWRTRAQATSDAAGRAVVRGHLGTYRVTVRVGGRTVQRTVTLARPGGAVEVRL